MATTASTQAFGSTKVWEEKVQALNAWISSSTVLVWIADKAGVQPWIVASAGAAWIAGFLLWGFTGELVCMAAAYLFPMYASFKALEDGKPEEVHTWLVYWVTYAALFLAEGLMYRVLVCIPFYHVIRLAFIIWLFLPATRGAQALYRWTVGPLLRRYRPKVDAAIQRSTENLGGELRKEISSVLQAAMTTGADAAEQMCIQELVVQELTKAAAAQVTKAAGLAPPGLVVASPSPARFGARARTASPRPSGPSEEGEAVGEMEHDHHD